MVDHSRFGSAVAKRHPRQRTHRARPGRGCIGLVFAVCLASVLCLSGCGGPLRVADPYFGERHARQNNMPILFYFKAWDSTQHRNMILDVFENPQVKRALTGIITIELEFAWSTPYKERYHVKGPQVCVLCKPDGTMVYKSRYVNPVPTPEQFIQWLEAAKPLAMPPKPTSAPTQPTTKPVQQDGPR